MEYVLQNTVDELSKNDDELSYFAIKRLTSVMDETKATHIRRYNLIEVLTPLQRCPLYRSSVMGLLEYYTKNVEKEANMTADESSETTKLKEVIAEQKAEIVKMEKELSHLQSWISIYTVLVLLLIVSFFFEKFMRHIIHPTL
ncbi:hypothetical protein QR680_011514 [Steinernema hermaphroditum]|uniref:Uncharacterized protein n=1 Tax=Steinernema hermaphroditum TaxID=289476 RepID=A0AA39LY74_9BILA|nr:hypothetical protein QR680_011514 [Steinernema hermaphroditum]